MNPQPSLEYKALGELQLKIGKRDNAIASYKKYLETGNDRLSGGENRRTLLV